MPVLIVNVVILTYAAMILTGREVPNHLETLTVAVVAFYFGGKAVASGVRNGEQKFADLTRISKGEDR